MRRVVLALSLALIAAPAWGQREDAADVAARAQARAAERDALRMDARTAAREVVRLRERLIALSRAQAADEGTALTQRARLTRLSEQEQVLTHRMNRERGRQGRLLGALQTYSRHPPPALLVSPRSANDAVRAAILMKALVPELQRRARLLQAELDAVARVRRDAALAGAALFLTESELADQRAETERLLIEKAALERRLNAGADSAAREAEALARRAASLGGLVGDLSGRAGAPAPVPPRRLAPPVKGRLIRRYGQGGADGLAWRAGPSAQVLSPAAGSVEYAGPLKGWGGVVILRLDGGYRVVLAGMDRVVDLTGRRVAPGEPVGRMAPKDSGDRDGAHDLYMEVRREGAAVDPAAWLDATP